MIQLALFDRPSLEIIVNSRHILMKFFLFFCPLSIGEKNKNETNKKFLYFLHGFLYILPLSSLNPL